MSCFEAVRVTVHNAYDAPPAFSQADGPAARCGNPPVGHPTTSRRLGLLAACLFSIIYSQSTLPAAEPVRLTQDGRLKFSPVFCAGGREIVYVDLVNPTLYQLRRLRLDDKTNVPLHPDALTSEFEPAFSRDGQIYAYLKTRGPLSIGLVIRSADGTLMGEVPPAPGFAGLRSPAISPDHSRVLYSFADKRNQQIFSVKPDGTDRRALTDSAGINNWPAFSPDGGTIVFGSSRDNDFELYTMDADVNSQRRLTHSPGQDIRPKFSPDGRSIAFTSHRDGNAEIYVMNSDGSAPRNVTRNPERDDYVDWQPDGKRLVFVGERAGRHDLYLVDVPHD
jgi:TolB protein